LVRKTRGARARPRARHGAENAAAPVAEIERLRAELAEARERLGAIEREGIDAFTRRRLAELDEARQVARGQALEAAAARSRAEAERKALADAIDRMPGLRGRLVRWAARGLVPR
jgi:predicted  nucleic acid-binding Zn-ribbon protein